MQCKSNIHNIFCTQCHVVGFPYCFMILGFHVTSSKFKLRELSILPFFYFHKVWAQLNIIIRTNFQVERVLHFAIEDAWISRLLREAAFSWQPGKLLCGLKMLLIFLDWLAFLFLKTENRSAIKLFSVILLSFWMLDNWPDSPSCGLCGWKCRMCQGNLGGWSWLWCSRQWK